LPVPEIIAVTDALLPCAADSFAAAQLAGLVLVASVRDWELRYKVILTNYAQDCHARFADYLDSYLKTLNGRITVGEITKHLSKMGPCQDVFVEHHQILTRETLNSHGYDPVNQYNTVILNRHEFVHKGKINLTLTDAKLYTTGGDAVLGCLSEALASTLREPAAILRGDIDRLLSDITAFANQTIAAQRRQQSNPLRRWLGMTQAQIFPGFADDYSAMFGLRIQRLLDQLHHYRVPLKNGDDSYLHPTKPESATSSASEIRTAILSL
jgi:hypothetical protein